ncbi:hypothetical protein CPB84DRAFT_1752003 [Gymnopilus junonius]|uniref:F-box domain-containing protein n=1 Tax=Gymnopilus junonius TaxID=109634 RepID=A0A9P5THF4_GYMJU|nr:hypothetical protein CPB84DRAFT_1752003 [Gymnopilus junonius]
MAPTLRLKIDDLAQALFLVLGPNEIGTQRTEINTEEVAQLEKQLWLALARTRMVNNATLSINRLPPEILARIFSFLQVPLPRTPFPLPKAFNSWFSILEVCRYWRIVALAFPRLWDHVYIRKRFDDPATMSIRHSGRLPLKVFYDLTTSNRESESHDSGEDEPSLLLSKAIDRVQELYLQLSGEAWDNQYFTTILASPAPKLERLAILGNWKDP